jgi:hypothetical protein
LSISVFLNPAKSSAEASQLALSKQITFAECAAAYITKKLPKPSKVQKVEHLIFLILAVC